MNKTWLVVLNAVLSPVLLRINLRRFCGGEVDGILRRRVTRQQCLCQVLFIVRCIVVGRINMLAIQAWLYQRCTTSGPDPAPDCVLSGPHSRFKSTRNFLWLATAL